MNYVEPHKGQTLITLLHQLNSFAKLVMTFIYRLFMWNKALVCLG